MKKPKIKMETTTIEKICIVIAIGILIFIAAMLSRISLAVDGDSTTGSSYVEIVARRNFGSTTSITTFKIDEYTTDEHEIGMRSGLELYCVQHQTRLSGLSGLYTKDDILSFVGNITYTPDTSATPETIQEHLDSYRSAPYLSRECDVNFTQNAPEIAYILTSDPMGTYSTEKQVAVWVALFDLNQLWNTSMEGISEQNLNTEAAEYKTYIQDMDTATIEAMEVPDISAKDNTNANEIKVLVDSEEGTYTIGPFSIDYVNGTRGGTTFGGISGMYFVGYNAEGEAVKNIDIDSYIYEGETVSHGLDLFSPGSDYVDRSAQSYPAGGREFYLKISNPNQGETDTSKMITDLSLHVDFHWMAAAASVSKLRAVSYYADWTYDEEDNRYEITGSYETLVQDHMAIIEYTDETIEIGGSGGGSISYANFGAGMATGRYLFKTSLDIGVEDGSLPRDISVLKVWDDEGYEDQRPSSIDVVLKANGETLYYATLSEENLWQYTWTGLDKEDESRNEIIYTVEEIRVDYEDWVSKYTSTITGSMEDGFVITNRIVEPIDIPVEKYWDDSNNKYDTRPDSIEVVLEANGTEKERRELNEENGWACVFTNLPYQDSEGIINYTIREEGCPPNYDSYIAGYMTDGFRIYNELHTIDIPVTKTWLDQNDKKGQRPDSIEVILKANETEIDRKELNEENSWSWVFTDLPEKTEDGEDIEYTIEEIEVDGYKTKIVGSIDYGFGFIIQNYGLIDVPVEKIWEDEGHEDERPESITVKLYRNNGEDTGRTITLSEENGWKGSFTGLDRSDEDGNPILYYVEEVKVDNYVTEVLGDMVTGYKIKNHFISDDVIVSVSKTWNDSDNFYNIRPESIEVQLYAGDEPVREPVTLSADNEWQYTWTGLDKEDDAGNDNEYRVEEVGATSYDVNIEKTEKESDGVTIYTFKLENTPKIVNIAAIKKWDDSDNLYGTRPTSIDVQLYADGQPIEDPVTLSADNEWQHMFPGLPKEDDNGRDIEYEIREETSDPRYESEVSVESGATENDEITTYVFKIENKLKTTNISVVKEWDDNRHELWRPHSIIVNLIEENLITGETQIKGTVELNEDNGWQETWTGLPEKNAEGQDISYTIAEEPLDDYTASISEEVTVVNDVTTHIFTLENTYIEKKIDVKVKKVWRNDTEEERPESITVNLIENGTRIIRYCRIKYRQRLDAHI